jgi:site-specific DNA-methyltransferase (adenine-specific)
MTRYKTDTLDLRLMDCMELMREFPDKHFDLAIVDPPYGIGESDSRNDSRGTCSVKWKRAKPTNYGKFTWDKEAPPESYFVELKRISRNQIIWGANHFIERIPSANSPCWIVWDKLNSGDFADAELAWASFKTAVRKVDLLWNGFIRCETAKRIHPTQKPIALYRWLLANYAKQGDKILDTHLGSMSHAIAAHYSGVHLTGCELDPDYFSAGIARVKAETAQMHMFADSRKSEQTETMKLL